MPYWKLLDETFAVQDFRCLRQITSAKAFEQGVSCYFWSQRTPACTLAPCFVGADLIFPEGLESLEEFREVASAVRAASKRDVYFLANMTEYGKTPSLKAVDFERSGYDIVIFPVSTLRAAMHAVVSVLGELKDRGSVANFAVDRMQTRQELYNMLKYNPAAGQQWAYPSPSQSVDSSPGRQGQAVPVGSEHLCAYESE